MKWLTLWDFFTCITLQAKCIITVSTRSFCNMFQGEWILWCCGATSPARVQKVWKVLFHSQFGKIEGLPQLCVRLCFCGGHYIVPAWCPASQWGGRSGLVLLTFEDVLFVTLQFCCLSGCFQSGGLNPRGTRQLSKPTRGGGHKQNSAPLFWILNQPLSLSPPQ